MTVLETVWVDSQSDASVQSSTVLDPGRRYRLVVAGNMSYQRDNVHDLGDPDTIMFPSPGFSAQVDRAGIDADVEYASSSGVEGGFSEPRHSTRFRVNTGSTGLVHPEADGGPFSVAQPGHAYMFEVVGEGSPLELWLFDTFRPGNNGMLRVEIERIAEGWKIGRL